MARKGTHVAFEKAGLLWRKPEKIRNHWRVRVRDLESGVTTTRTLKASTFKGAVDEVRDLADEMSRGNDVLELDAGDDPAPSLGCALDRFLKAKDVRDVTLRDYRHVVELLERAFGEDTLVRDLTLEDVERFEVERLRWKDEASGIRYSPRSRRKYLQFLSSFLSWCVDHEYRDTNPAAKHLRRLTPRLRKQEKETQMNIGKPLTVEESRKVIRAAAARYELDTTPKGRSTRVITVTPPRDLWLAIFLALRVGLRRRNILELRWEDLDLKEGTLSFPADRMKSAWPFEVPLHQEVVEVLGRRRRETLTVLESQGEPVLSLGKELCRPFQRTLERAGIGLRRFHDCRVTFATELGAIAPAYVVAQLLGHGRTDSTSRYAAHQRIEDLRGWLDRLPRLVGNEKTASRFLA